MNVSDQIVEEVDKVSQEIAIYFLLGWGSRGSKVNKKDEFTITTTLSQFHDAMKTYIREFYNPWWFHRLSDLQNLAEPSHSEQLEIDTILANISKLYYAGLPQDNLVKEVQDYVWTNRIYPSVQRIIKLLMN